MVSPTLVHVVPLAERSLMQLSALAEATGVSIPTIKFYLREGVLPRGEAVSATRAEYTEEHVKRIRLITALTDVRSLPMARVKEILGLVDAPLRDPSESLSRAIGALPPYVADSADGDYPLAREAIAALDFVYDTRSAAVKQLNSAIQAVKDADLFWEADDIAFYGQLAMTIAQRELQPLATMNPRDIVGFAVMGTAMYEPIILAMRRLAHQTLNTRAMQQRGAPGSIPSTPSRPQPRASAHPPAPTRAPATDDEGSETPTA